MEITEKENNRTKSNMYAVRQKENILDEETEKAITNICRTYSTKKEIMEEILKLPLFQQHQTPKQELKTDLTDEL